MTSQIQLSAKSHNGDIIVVGGDDVDQFKVNLTAFLGDVDTARAKFEQLQALVTGGGKANGYQPDVINEAENVVRGAFPDAAPVQSQAPAYERPARPAGPPPGQSTPPVCEHGYAREYKSGTSAAGKAWKAWMCPLKKNEGACAPQWIR